MTSCPTVPPSTTANTGKSAPGLQDRNPNEQRVKQETAIEGGGLRRRGGGPLTGTLITATDRVSGAKGAPHEGPGGRVCCTQAWA